MRHRTIQLVFHKVIYFPKFYIYIRKIQNVFKTQRYITNVASSMLLGLHRELPVMTLKTVRSFFIMLRLSSLFIFERDILFHLEKNVGSYSIEVENVRWVSQIYEAYIPNSI